MSTARDTNRAWILGLCETGLAAMRSLARAGIQVIGVDWNPNEVGCFSRFCSFEYSPSPIENPEALVEWLISRGKQYRLPGVLLPASDAYAAFISSYRDALTPYFLFALPPAPIMDALLDKYEHFRLAEQLKEMPPFTILIDENTDITEASTQLCFPVYIKARHTHLWKQVYTTKGFLAETPDEFIQICNQIVRNRLSAVVQQVIDVPMINHFEISFYRSVQTGHPILANLPVRKIRQYPCRLGCGSMVETYENPEVSEKALSFIEKIDFQGIGNIEYIYDQQANAYYLVELNPRLWLQNAQADYCGMNFPLIAYRDLLGEPQSPVPRAKPGIKWIDLVLDFLSFFELQRMGDLNLLTWLRSMKGVKVVATFAWDDLNPILHELVYGIKTLFSRSSIFHRENSR